MVGILRAALAKLLERIEGAAFVINDRGKIGIANEAGQQLRRDRGEEVDDALRAAITGRPSALTFELLPITHGSCTGWLAVRQHVSVLDGRDRCLERATRRWGLTPRQREVLELVLRGTATATIASALCVSERAVEHHVTALFDKVGVDGRTALVATVLMQVS